MQGAQCIIPIALEVHLSPAGTEVKFIPSCFDLCLLKWLRTSLPEGTWNSLCCGLQLWLQVLELWATARLIWSEMCIFCISTYFVGVLIFFFSSRSLFFVSTGRSIIMIHAGWMIIFIWLDFLHGNVPSPFPQNPCMMYIHVQVCDNTRICILQFHPASKQELQVIWNFLCLMISCSNCYFFALALG